MNGQRESQHRGHCMGSNLATIGWVTASDSWRRMRTAERACALRSTDRARTGARESHRAAANNGLLQFCSSAALRAPKPPHSLQQVAFCSVVLPPYPVKGSRTQAVCGEHSWAMHSSCV